MWLPGVVGSAGLGLVPADREVVAAPLQASRLRMENLGSSKFV